MKQYCKAMKDRNDKMWGKFYDPKTRIARHAKWYMIAPILLICVGIIMLAIPGVGFNLGLDFTGGSVIEAVGFESREAARSVGDEVDEFLRGYGVTRNITTPQAIGGAGWSINVQFQITRGVDMEMIAAEISRIIRDATDGDIIPSTTETISASASNEMIMMTFIAIAVSLIAILVYMLFRFKFTSGVAALIGLVHDVFVAVALCIIFRVQINYVFVAAMITVVVYSLNNTIVQFDRIRGKEKALNSMGAKYDVEKVVDESIKEVFARTMATTATTIIPVLALVFLPVPLIREFALPILFGLIAGTFSTIFITSSLYIRFENYRLKRNRAPKKMVRQESLMSSD